MNQQDYDEAMQSHRTLVRELDVTMNGFDGAAKQASLCDLVSQLKQHIEDAKRLGKLLDMVTSCRVKFGPDNKPKQLTLIIKNSVQTSLGYQGELRALLNGITSTFPPDVDVERME